MRVFRIKNGVRAAGNRHPEIRLVTIKFNVAIWIVSFRGNAARSKVSPADQFFSGDNVLNVYESPVRLKTCRGATAPFIMADDGNELVFDQRDTARRVFVQVGPPEKIEGCPEKRVPFPMCICIIQRIGNHKKVPKIA